MHTEYTTNLVLQQQAPIKAAFVNPNKVHKTNTQKRLDAILASDTTNPNTWMIK